MPKNNGKILSIIVFLATVTLIFLLWHLLGNRNLTSPFLYTFNVDGRLEEASGMIESKSPYWWLNSGGFLTIKNGTGRVNQGEMPFLSKWRLLYRISNPTDTDNGFHPQNIFRLISRNQWLDFSEEAYFRILKDNLSESPNRNISNGLLLFSRYLDENNLYYAGLRVDGTAVIKIKRQGEYTTLAQKKIFEGNYHRYDNPNLIPKEKWIGIKSQIKNENSAVSLGLFLDLNESGEWIKVLETRNGGENLLHEPIYQEGYAGIRTDFMDVEFQRFKVVNL